MRKRMEKIIAKCLAVCFFCTLLAGLTGWTGVLAANEEFVYAGKHSVKIHSEGLGSAEKYVFFTQTVKNLTANTDYEVKFFAKGKSGTARILNAATWKTFEKEISVGGSAWKEYTLSFNSQNETQLIVAFTGNPYGGKGDIYFDQVSFCKKGDGTNLILNPGFEEGETSWGKWEDPVSFVTSDTEVVPGEPLPTADPSVTAKPTMTPTAAPTATEAAGGSDENIPYVYEGYQSIKIHSQGLGSAERYVFFPQYLKNIEPNTDYVVTVWSKGGSGTMRINKANDDGSWGNYTGYTEINGGGNWKQFTHEFNSGNEKQLILLFSNNPFGGKHDTYIDNVSVCKKGDTVNVLTNPGFEDGAAGWGSINDPIFLVRSSQYVTPGEPLPTADPSVTAKPTASADPDASDENRINIYEGNHALKVRSQSGDGFTMTGQGVKLSPNTDYTATFWAKGGPGNFRMMQGWSTVHKDQQVNAGDSWKQYTVEFNSGDNSELTYSFTNNPFAGKGFMYIDNAALCVKGSDENLLKNSGFEEGKTAWSAWNDIFTLISCITPVDPVNPPGETTEPGEMKEAPLPDNRGGNAALDVYIGPGSLVFDSDRSKREGKVTQEIAVQKNTEYVAILWAKNQNGVNSSFDVTNTEGKSLIGGARKISQGNWQRFLVEFNSGENTTAIYTISATANVKGRVAYDFGFFSPKYIPVTDKTAKNLLVNHNFNNGTEGWTGISDPFVTYYDQPESSNDVISGGVRIMCTGDSITQGVGAETDPDGYKFKLFEKYAKDGTNINFVGPRDLKEEFGHGSGHAGYSGWTIGGIAGQIEYWMYNYEPQAILLMIGTNDILLDRDGEEENNMYEEAPARMEALVDRIVELDPDIQLFVGTVAPLGNGNANKRVQEYNAFLKEMAATKQENVKLVDVNSYLKPSDLTSDNVHPNDNGYTKMAQAWYDGTHETLEAMVPAEYEVNTDIAHTGTGALKYEPYHVPYYTLQEYFFTSQYIKGVEKNTDYKVRYWVKGDLGLSIQTRIQKSNLMSWQWGDTLASKESACGPKWTPVEYTFNTEEADLVILHFVHACRSRGTVYIDDLAVWKADDPAETNLAENGSFEGSAGWRPSWPFSLVTESDYIANQVRENLQITMGGEAVYKLKEGSVNVSADLTDTGLNGTLVAAVYQDGVMTAHGKSAAGTGELNVEIAVGKVNENTELKVMLMDAGDSITPLMPVKTIKQ